MWLGESHQGEGRTSRLRTPPPESTPLRVAERLSTTVSAQPRNVSGLIPTRDPIRYTARLNVSDASGLHTLMSRHVTSPSANGVDESRAERTEEETAWLRDRVPAIEAVNPSEVESAVTLPRSDLRVAVARL